MKNFLYKKISEIIVWLQKISQSLLLPLIFVPFIVVSTTISQYFNKPMIIGLYLPIFMPVIFSVGVAIGLSDKKNKFVGFCGLLFYLVGLFEFVVIDSRLLNLHLNTSISYGIFCGVCAAIIYDKFKNVRLNECFLLLRGEKFTIFAVIIGSIIINLLFAPVIFYISDLTDKAGNSLGIIAQDYHVFFAFFYGMLGRLLVPFGLHHLFNNFIFWKVGSYNGIKGEIARFFSGDKTAGNITSGMYLITLFGLPAAALAIFLSLPKNKKKKYSFSIFSTIISSVITGVTEPVEYLFMFASPILYFVHSILSGISFFLASYLNIRIVYGFSAGIFDYFVSNKLASNTELIFYSGLIIFFVYFVIFYFSIKLFKIPILEHLTLGNTLKNREANTSGRYLTQNKIRSVAENYIEALGGETNIEELFSCTTRLRVVVHNTAFVDEKRIMEIGALGVNKFGKNYVQIIIRSGLDELYCKMKEIHETATN